MQANENDNSQDLGMIKIRSFINPTEYAMAKSYLEGNGIECYESGEIANRLYVINEGIALYVNEKQASDAVKLLIEGKYMIEEDLEPSGEIKFIQKILNFFKKH